MSLFWEKMFRPLIFTLEAERAHDIGVKDLRFGLTTEFAQRMTAKHYAGEPFSEIERFGLKFANPVGIAAGFDKNGVVVDQLASLGFGFVEVGTVTFRPQKGNEKPRLFRLPDDKALINRLGFNNEGAKIVASRLKNLNRKCVVGINIGKNKDVPNEEAVENYLAGFDLVHPAADYIALNISSPNTPNLRGLQKTENLEELLSAVQKRNQELSAETSGKPILVKIAPDLTEREIEAITDICIQNKISGVIATNTTTSRDGLRTKNVGSIGDGGLSGKPVADISNQVIKTIFRHSKGKVPRIGVGGSFTAGDAFEKIAAGASLLQAYTGFVYQGLSFASDLNRGLKAIMDERGFSSIDNAVGTTAV